MKKDLFLRQGSTDPFNRRSSEDTSTDPAPSRRSDSDASQQKDSDSEEQLVMLLNKIALHDPTALVSAIRQMLKGFRSELLKADPFRTDTMDYKNHKAQTLDIFKGFSNLNWNEIEFIFPSGDGLRIQCRGMEARYGYEVLGFSDRRTVGRPDSLWWLLHSLAEYNGTIPWRNNISANKKLPKRMQLLRDRLQSLTGLATDPFYPYRRHREYRARFRIRMQDNGAYPSEPDEPASETSEFFTGEANKYRKHKLNST